MRNRKMDASDDYAFGAGSSFLVNSAEAVAQAVKTRLRLFAGEWFLDDRIGLDRGQILGTNTQGTRDFEIQQRIIGTLGVRSIINYSSGVENRAFSVTATIDTIYGSTTITEKL